MTWNFFNCSTDSRIGSLSLSPAVYELPSMEYLVCGSNRKHSVNSFVTLKTAERNIGFAITVLVRVGACRSSTLFSWWWISRNRISILDVKPAYEKIKLNFKQDTCN